MKRSDIIHTIVGGTLFAFVLLLPFLISKNFFSHSNQGSSFLSCPFFVDKNQNKTCDVLETSLVSGGSSTSMLSGFFRPEAWIVIGFLLLGTILVLKKKLFYLRYFTLAVSLIFLGFFVWPSVCPFLSLQTLFSSKTGLATVALVVFVTPIIFSLIVGRIFCGWVCSLGAFQEFVYIGFNKIRTFISSLRKVKGKERGKRATRQNGQWDEIHSKFIYLKYLVLAGVVLGALAYKKSVMCGADPFGALFGFFRTPLSWASLIILTLLSLFIYRFWCKYLCPYGAILALFSKISIFKPKIELSKCTHCGLCKKVCPMKAIDLTHNKIDAGECIGCGDCMKSCPQKAIGIHL